ncbi:hypothetical protein BC829DRAFT_399445 [Chytridium lagenaria]|nr:hypothetical protein BC829DRAFT_399445 [Chytridium lagenaria]
MRAIRVTVTPGVSSVVTQSVMLLPHVIVHREELCEEILGIASVMMHARWVLDHPYRCGITKSVFSIKMDYLMRILSGGCGWRNGVVMMMVENIEVAGKLTAVSRSAKVEKLFRIRVEQFQENVFLLDGSAGLTKVVFLIQLLVRALQGRGCR